MGRMPSGGAGEVRSLALSAPLYSSDVARGTAPLGGSAEPLEASLLRDASGTTLRFARRLRNEGLPAGAVPVEVASPAFLNWAYGPSDELQYHGNNRGSFQQVFSAASEAPAAAPAAPRGRKSAGALPASRLRTHGRLMLIAWAGLLPAGAVLGRLVQHPRLRPYSLYVHVAVQAAGLAVATVSFALIVAGAPRLHRRASMALTRAMQRCVALCPSMIPCEFRTRTARSESPRCVCCGRSR